MKHKTIWQVNLSIRTLSRICPVPQTNFPSFFHTLVVPWSSQKSYCPKKTLNLLQHTTICFYSKTFHNRENFASKLENDAEYESARETCINMKETSFDISIQNSTNQFLILHVPPGLLISGLWGRSSNWRLFSCMWETFAEYFHLVPTCLQNDPTDFQKCPTWLQDGST